MQEKMFRSIKMIIIIILCTCQTHHGLFILPQPEVLRKTENTVVFVACQTEPCLFY